MMSRQIQFTTVGGNTGAADSYYDRCVGTHEINLDSEVVKGILRPAYCMEHSYTIFTCSNCGAMRPEIARIVNLIKSFIYSIKKMLDNFTANI